MSNESLQIEVPREWRMKNGNRVPHAILESDWSIKQGEKASIFSSSSCFIVPCCMALNAPDLQFGWPKLQNEWLRHVARNYDWWQFNCSHKGFLGVFSLHTWQFLLKELGAQVGLTESARLLPRENLKLSSGDNLLGWWTVAPKFSWDLLNTLLVVQIGSN